MVALDVLLLFYICGVCGSLIGAAFYAFPTTWKELENVLTIALVWPIYIYHQYNNELERRVAERHKINCAHLIGELESRGRLVQVLAENAAIQNEQYQELLKKYNELRGVELPKTFNGESVLTKEGKPNNEPL